MYSCFCLNILIEGAADFEKVTPEFLDLTEEERNDSFFQQDIQQIKKLKNITKAQASFVQTRNIGQWTVNCCINCICEAYAVHREKGASCVIMYSKLRDYTSIERIKKAEALSKVFNIIVDSGDTGDGKVLSSYRLCDTGAIIRNIRETMTEFLRKESLAVEEKIRKFSEEQYEILNNLKEKAYEEHGSLVRVVQSITDQTKFECTKKSPQVSESMDASPKSFALTDPPSLNSSAKLEPPTRHTPKRQKSSPAAPVSSFDAEGLFDFEASDGMSSQPESEADESDRDESKDGMAVPRQRAPRGSIAKSLPMNIPTFLSQGRNSSTEDLDDYPQNDNVDIAASIKALAKSVHGDAVFGELPRPRFSTQI